MLDLGRYDEASTLLARLVSAEPGSGRAWCLFARAHLGADRFAEAVEAANRAAAIEPAEEWPHRLASNALMHLGHHAEALRAAAESRRLAPAYWQTHVCVAQAALAAGAARASPPRRRPRRAGSRPNEPDVHFLSGKVALARGDLDGARGPPGARPGPRPGAQRRHERARPDPAAPPRHGRRDQALHQRGADHARRAHLQQEHRRGHRAVGVADDLRLRACRDDPAVGPRGDAHRTGCRSPPGSARSRSATVVSFVVMVTAAAARGAAAGPPDGAQPPGRRPPWPSPSAAWRSRSPPSRSCRPAELPQTLPIAIIITIVARIVATARLRSPVGPNPPRQPHQPHPAPSPPCRRR